MQRVTITVDDELMVELDRIIAARGYQNRSEAIRDLARAGIREAKRRRVDVVTHGRDGRIRSKDSYGNESPVLDTEH